MGRIFGTLRRLCPSKTEVGPTCMPWWMERRTGQNLDRCRTPTDRPGRAPIQGPAGLDEGTPGGDPRGPRHLAGTEGRRPETAIAPPIPRTERRQNADRTRAERGQNADRPRTERGQNADRATDQIEAQGLPSCYRASTDKEGMDPPCLGGTPITSEQNPNRAWIGPTL